MNDKGDVNLKAKLFWKIFQEQWSNISAEDEGKWSNSAKWTKFMLGHGEANKAVNAGFLPFCVQTYMKCLNIDDEPMIRCEWDKIDLVGLKSHDPGDVYQSSLHVMIEHENDVNRFDIETEFYKLLHWRAPLKVLICYQPANKTDDDRMTRKLEVFEKMHARVAALMGRDNAEYLILLGTRVDNKKCFKAYELNSEGWACLIPL